MKFEDLATKEDLQRLEDRLLEAVLKTSGGSTSLGWVRSQQVADALGVSRSHVQTLRDRGEISFSKIGNIVYYNLDDIKEALERQAVQKL